jgi:hypothetical protein
MTEALLHEFEAENGSEDAHLESLQIPAGGDAYLSSVGPFPSSLTKLDAGSFNSMDQWWLNPADLDGNEENFPTGMGVSPGSLLDDALKLPDLTSFLPPVSTKKRLRLVTERDYEDEAELNRPVKRPDVVTTTIGGDNASQIDEADIVSCMCLGASGPLIGASSHFNLSSTGQAAITGSAPPFSIMHDPTQQPARGLSGLGVFRRVARGFRESLRPQGQQQTHLSQLSTTPVGGGVMVAQQDIDAALRSGNYYTQRCLLPLHLRRPQNSDPGHDAAHFDSNLVLRGAPQNGRQGSSRCRPPPSSRPRPLQLAVHDSTLSVDSSLASWDGSSLRASSSAASSRSLGSLSNSIAGRSSGAFTPLSSTSSFPRVREGGEIWISTPSSDNGNGGDIATTSDSPGSSHSLAFQRSPGQYFGPQATTNYQCICCKAPKTFASQEKLRYS